MLKPQHPGPLLIVDDREDVRLALERFLSLYFEQVHAAGTPGDAESALNEYRPTLVLCDYWLGDEYPPATDLIPGWRERYPTIERVALMTGTKASALGRAQGVDAVFQKPLDLKQVTAFLLGKGQASGTQMG